MLLISSLIALTYFCVDIQTHSVAPTANAFPKRLWRAPRFLKAKAPHTGDRTCHAVGSVPRTVVGLSLVEVSLAALRMAAVKTEH